MYPYYCPQCKQKYELQMQDSQCPSCGQRGVHPITNHKPYARHWRYKRFTKTANCERTYGLRHKTREEIDNEIETTERTTKSLCPNRR